MSSCNRRELPCLWVLQRNLCSKCLWTNTGHWQFIKVLSDFFLIRIILFIHLYSLVMRSATSFAVFLSYSSHPFQSRKWQLIFTCSKTNDSHSERSICQCWEYQVLSHAYESLLITVFVLILAILYKLFCFKIQIFSFLCFPVCAVQVTSLVSLSLQKFTLFI